MTLNTDHNSASMLGIDYGQWIKLIVYSLLLVNFSYYIVDDLNKLSHTYHEGWKWFDWTSAFATSLDESGWFMLLFLLELETYVLSDAAFTRFRIALMLAVRVLCYLVIGHAVVAYTDHLLDLFNRQQHLDTTLCSFVGEELSFTRNLAYWVLDAANCGSLSSDHVFFVFSQGQLVTDPSGMEVELELAWVDLVEVLVWLCILAMIEMQVQLQDRGITQGRLLVFAHIMKLTLYSVLWFICAYWLYRGHWVFAWDEALWILGFVAIGMNLSQWRKEIEADVGASRQT